MKYGILLNKIKLDNLHYIDYNYLKKQIYNINFEKILINNIDLFEHNYKLIKIFNEEIYNYIIINYLSIHKIIKKYNKKNNKSFTISLNKYKFYNDVINPKYINGDICNICYENGFIIKTECKHEFCFKCLLKCNNIFSTCPNCRKYCILDPILIYINNIIDNTDNKYSPICRFLIDLISDLHIDQWDNKYNIKYPCGQIIDKPFILNNTKSDILIIAGDISDDLDLSLNYMNNISDKYDKILFVDGNHEHVNAYPDLYDINFIHKKVNELNNDKIIYLPNNEYIINDKVFIGYSGWWNYDNKNDLENAKSYFDRWIPKFTEEDNIKFMNNVLKQAEYEYDKIITLLDKYSNDDSIKEIILITHSVGHEDLEIVNKSTHYNTMFNNIKYDKLNNWFFGHTHYEINDKKNGINYICNPRGRPDDFNRLKYDIKTIKI